MMIALRMVRLALLFAAIPAAAQDAPPSDATLTQPLALFNAVCINGSARLSRKIAAAATYPALPEAAKRALGASTATTRAEAEKLPAPAAAAVPNTIYKIGDNQLYLLVPGAAETGAPLGDSCAVLWHAIGDEDYYSARKLALPGEAAVPMTARPSASPVRAAVAISANGEARLIAATYSGWVVLRSAAATPSPAGAQ
jgi:hypothetical protein